MSRPDFLSWRKAPWLALALLPMILSVAAMLVRGRQWWEAGILALLGIVTTVLLLETLWAGVTWSNWGTFHRDREPVRYWCDVAILAVVYVGIAVAGWFG